MNVLTDFVLGLGHARGCSDGLGVQTGVVMSWITHGL